MPAARGKLYLTSNATALYVQAALKFTPQLYHLCSSYVHAYVNVNQRFFGHAWPVGPQFRIPKQPSF